MSTEPTENSGLDKAIGDVLETLNTLDAESKEYAAATDQLVKLHALKMAEETTSLTKIEKIHAMEKEDRPSRVSPDTVVMVAGNLLGILFIVLHEERHIMSSKALGFLKALR